MPTISKLSLTTELTLLVERYQQVNGIETKTAALYELIARGYADWQVELDTKHGDDSAAIWSATQEQENALFEAFHAEQPDEHWFALWFARRFAPKHGGKRDGAGNPNWKQK